MLYAVRMDAGYAGAGALTVDLPRRGRKQFVRGATKRDDPGYPYAEFEGTEKEARGIRDSGLSVEPIGRSALAASQFADAPATPEKARPPRRKRKG
jgi:hypothetical protein